MQRLHRGSSYLGLNFMKAALSECIGDANWCAPPAQARPRSLQQPATAGRSSLHDGAARNQREAQAIAATPSEIRRSTTAGAQVLLDQPQGWPLAPVPLLYCHTLSLLNFR